MSFGGPMFERARSGPWESVHKKDGGHYNTYGIDAKDAMAALREFFPEGMADEMNIVFFSTSGIHGSYCTIEDFEAGMDLPEDHNDKRSDVTFVVFQPRIVTLRYGNCIPQSADDIAFLKKLRASSWAASQKVGAP